jgi:Ser/Thr protein kinase RdoA (MazF antagonist)
MITVAERRVVTQSANSVPFAGLTPDTVLQLAAAAGLNPDGRMFALNSYENRVYRLGQEDGPAVVVKFYRAGRWSDAQILEEHAFAERLQAADILVSAPLPLGSATLFRAHGYRMAAFALVSGGAPDLEQPGALALLGRTLARLHLCGRTAGFRQRPVLDAGRMGARARRVVLNSPWLPAQCRNRYEAISGQLCSAIVESFERHAVVGQSIHGDCHLGNILWTERGPLFVDLDDCQTGPVMQDLWMFLSGDAGDQRHQWAQLLDGYEQFAHVDYSELLLIEALRALRMLNYSAWIAERWDDPAFPRAFPGFTETSFWDRHINDLAEQIATIAEPPLLSG